MAMSPGESRTVLIAADAIRLGAVVGGSHNGGVTRKIDLRCGRLLAGEPLEAGDTCLRNHILPIERAGVQEIEIHAVIAESRFRSHGGRNDVDVTQTSVLSA